MNKPYRIAMLCLEKQKRLECHATHYAPFMCDCHPEVMRALQYDIHVWFTDGNHTDQFYNINPIGGFRIVKIWDIQSRARAEAVASLICDAPEVCDAPDETLEGIDAVFIADGGGDGSLHKELVTPFLERRIPAFIDKPFARDYKDAKAMVDLALKMDTPIFTASILSHVNEVQYFKDRWQEIYPPGLGFVKGYGCHLGGTIHGLSLAQATFGTGVDWVECMGEPPEDALTLANDKIIGRALPVGSLPLEIIRLHYKENDLQVIIVNTLGHTHDWFTVEVWGRRPADVRFERRNHRKQWLHSDMIGDPEYLNGTTNIVRMFRNMLETRKPPVPYETPLELIAIVSAARKAQQEHRRVYLEEIRGSG